MGEKRILLDRARYKIRKKVKGVRKREKEETTNGDRLAEGESEIEGRRERGRRVERNGKRGPTKTQTYFHGPVQCSAL